MAFSYMFWLFRAESFKFVKYLMKKFVRLLVLYYLINKIRVLYHCHVPVRANRQPFKGDIQEGNRQRHKNEISCFTTQQIGTRRSQR